VTLELRVEGVTVVVGAGATLLEVCDAAGQYVPRLCYYPGLSCCARSGVSGVECGLCAVRFGDGTTALACVTPATPGAEITVDDPGLRALRLERLASILARHPHICLTCPDRDGCTRDECTYGISPGARCCGEFGHCELGQLVGHLDSHTVLPRTAVEVSRAADVEGRIRREPGLCVGCGRCVTACEVLPEAGKALEMAPAPAEPGRSALTGLAPDPRLVARPKRGTLKASGCTFCGQCVLLCPTGALTAPGDEGARWLAGRRERSELARPMLPPVTWQALSPRNLTAVPREAGVFQLVDANGQVLRISGVADLQRGLMRALDEQACTAAAHFRVELDPLFTQRESELLARYAQEHGHLPPGNDLGDDLFADDLF
jgi:predicted molibdopterin-dependent oxidoreductase YjgC